MPANYPVMANLSFAKRTAATPAIGKVTSIKFPEIVRKAIDTSVLGTTWSTAAANPFAETNEIELTMNYDPADAEQGDLFTEIKRCLGAGSTGYTLAIGSTIGTAAGGSVLTFNAFVTKHQFSEATKEGLIKLNVNLKIDGAIGLA